MTSCNTCGHAGNAHLFGRNCLKEGCECTIAVYLCHGCNREVEFLGWHALGSPMYIGEDNAGRVQNNPETQQSCIRLCRDCSDQIREQLHLLYDRLFKGEFAPVAYLRSDEHHKPPISLKMTDEGDLVSVRGGVSIQLDQLKQVGEHGGKPLYDFDFS